MPALKTSFVDDTLAIQFVQSDLRDLQNVFQAGAELLDACAAARRRMLLDFTGVEFITSEMLGQLFVLASRCRGAAVTLLGCGASSEIRLILETVRFVDVVPVYADQQSALAAFAARETQIGQSQEFSVHPDMLAKSAAEGDPEAEFDLAVCYEQGAGVDQDMTEALKRFRHAADAGHAEAQYKLGAAHAYGIQVEQDYDQAIVWYKKAAQQHQPDALYALGMTYRYGIGVDADQTAAANWYEQAATQGHKRAGEELSRMSAESGK